jgi:predicted CoA-binding protein
MRVAVLGASPNSDRYSNRAIRSLRQHGHEVIPINPAHKLIEGLAVVPTLAADPSPIDTVTVYVSPKHIEPLIDGIIAARPRRIIANPGAESDTLREQARAAGIEYVEACTLVMLSTGQF